VFIFIFISLNFGINVDGVSEKSHSLNLVKIILKFRCIRMFCSRSLKFSCLSWKLL